MNIEKYFRNVATGLFTLYLSCGVSHSAENHRLFEYSTIVGPAISQKVHSAAIYTIEMNRKSSAVNAGDMVKFPLPDGTVLNITVTRKKFTENGDTQITGQYQADGTAIITYGKDSTFANFTSSSHSYGIGIDANKQSFLVDYKNSNFELNLGNDARFPPGFQQMRHLNRKRSSPPAIAQRLLPNGKYEVTLLAVYSPQFAAGFTNPETRINQMIAFSNAAYDRSGINIEMRLAHAQQLSFSNSSSTGTLLSQVTNGTGDFSSVNAIRNQYYADLVAVLPFTTSGSIGGIAWVNGDSEAFAYSVSQFAVWGSDALFAHEIGHNLGSGHERLSANASQPDPCNGGYTGYACGPGNGTEGTIMSYLNDAAWGFVFSNPLLTCTNQNGSMQSCGIANGSSNAADNKTSFNITAPLVSDFRIDTSNDDDKDGIQNDVDNCPNVANPDQLNTDSDTFGNACDSDDDNDGINDPEDNCPLNANPNQEDSDNNGIGDVCQDDSLCLPIKVSSTNFAMVCL